MNIRRTAVLAGTAAALTSFAVLPPAALASGNDDVIQRGGPCAGGDWKLKAKHDDGRLEVEFEIDTNQNGQVWHVRISDNGNRVFAGNRTTHGRSGSFSVEIRPGNRAGTDTIKARATRGGITCGGNVQV